MQTEQLNTLNIMNTETQQTRNTGTIQITTFLLGDELFGIDALHVQEILPHQKITAVPRAPEYIKGLINLRGQIITVLDLRSRLGFEQAGDDVVGMNLIVNSSEGQMSILVDQIGNVLDIATNRFSPPPGTIRGVAVHYIQKVCQLEEALLILLDADAILQH